MMLLFLLANGAVPALMRFSAPAVKKPPSGLRGLVPVVSDRWEQGRPGVGRGGRGAGRGGGDTMGGGVGGGWGGGGCPGPESIYIYI